MSYTPEQGYIGWIRRAPGRWRSFWIWSVATGASCGGWLASIDAVSGIRTIFLGCVLAVTLREALDMKP